MFRAPSLPPPSSLQFSAVTTLPSGYKSLFLPHVLTRHDVPLPGVCCLPRGSSQNFFPCRPIAATLAAAPTFAAAFTAAVANADAVRWRWSAPPPVLLSPPTATSSPAWRLNSPLVHPPPSPGRRIARAPGGPDSAAPWGHRRLPPLPPPTDALAICITAGAV